MIVGDCKREILCADLKVFALNDKLLLKRIHLENVLIFADMDTHFICDFQNVYT